MRASETMYDIAIVGAGAAGLTAAIFAARVSREASTSQRIVLVDGARRPGAKILVSGGGRCNVTNASVTPEDYEGGPRTIIRKVLRGFGEQATREWFAGMGVELREEPGGKLFPVTNSARTVLDALLAEVHAAGVETRWGWRVADVVEDSPANRRGGRHEEPKTTPVGFKLHRIPDHSATQEHAAAGHKTGPAGVPREIIRARRVILAAGGMALPKSGSDGAALGWARAMGHTVVHPVPALAPLVVSPGRAPGGQLASLAGITLEVRLELRDEAGRLVATRTAPVVLTHFGLSGPAAMDISRHLARNRADTPQRALRLTMGHPSLPDVAAAERLLLDEAAASPSRQLATTMGRFYPERLARLLGDDLGRLGALTRAARREAATRLTALALPVAGDRGFAFAETTAGGVDLREVDPHTMESRRVRGLFLCGEMLDVDGRIGGFNFQWAWSSGHAAGRGAAQPSGDDQA